MAPLPRKEAMDLAVLRKETAMAARTRSGVVWMPKGKATSSPTSPHPTPLLLVSPSISFWFSSCPDPVSLSEAVGPLKLHLRDLVHFAVNNNRDVTAVEGSTRWSLPVYYRGTSEFVHHDSSRGMNRWHAETLFEAVKGFVGDDGEARYLEGFTPQQNNGYDCGLYVMTIARVVCDWFREGEAENEGEIWFSALKEEVDTEAVAELRGELLRLILGLMEKS